MPEVGFEPTIPVFERAKTVHASDRAATVIGWTAMYQYVFFFIYLVCEAIGTAATPGLLC
jgi:hypothetical protein